MVKQFGLWTLLMGMVFSSSLFAQIPDPVQFSVVSVPDTVMAGESFEIELHASIEGDWHLYSVLNINLQHY